MDLNKILLKTTFLRFRENSFKEWMGNRSTALATESSFFERSSLRQQVGAPAKSHRVLLWTYRTCVSKTFLRGGPLETRPRTTTCFWAPRDYWQVQLHKEWLDSNSWGQAHCPVRWPLGPLSRSYGRESGHALKHKVGKNQRHSIKRRIKTTKSLLASYLSTQTIQRLRGTTWLTSRRCLFQGMRA